VSISERAFEAAIECRLLQSGPTPVPATRPACTMRWRRTGRPLPAADWRTGCLYVRSGPGTVRLSHESSAKYLATRFPAAPQPS